MNSRIVCAALESVGISYEVIASTLESQVAALLKALKAPATLMRTLADTIKHTKDLEKVVHRFPKLFPDGVEYKLFRNGSKKLELEYIGNDDLDCLTLVYDPATNKLRIVSFNTVLDELTDDGWESE